MFKHTHRTTTETETRTSKHRYEFVLRGSDRNSPSNRFEDRVISWHKTEPNAAKAAKTATKWACDLSIEPTEQIEEVGS